jgi:3-phenylpropionate/trans-cinnamate dioxygenase ferredoxin reductase subunit
MTAARTLVVVGAGLAGAKAAEGARAAGYGGRVVLVGDEPALPYELPPLSKAVLRGDAGPASARVHGGGFYAEHGIELVAGRAVRLDPASRQVELASGATLPFDAVVLAPGARARRLPVPGAELAGVHHLRTMDDALALRDAIRRAGRVAVVGAGWIGSEVAASARQVGADVVLVDPAPTPLHRLLGDELGAVFRALHADHGVTLRLGVGVHALRGTGSVEEVVLGDGTVEPADVVVAGVGAVPRLDVAHATPGVVVEDGIVTDETLETTVPGVFAAGDAASAWHPRYGRHLRVEHWANALNQGLAAGRNAVGERTPYTRLPYFFSDQYDLGLEYVGHHEPGDAIVVRGDLHAREFVAFWHRDGVVSAAMNVNVWDVVEDLKGIVSSGAAVEPAQLADAAVPFAALARPAAAAGQR